jgi:hypothetical protein
MRNRLAALDTAKVEWEALRPKTQGLSHAEVGHAADQAAKDALLDGTKSVTTDLLVEALAERQAGVG